jgi:hypothetical protein
MCSRVGDASICFLIRCYLLNRLVYYVSNCCKFDEIMMNLSSRDFTNLHKNLARFAHVIYSSTFIKALVTGANNETCFETSQLLIKPAKLSYHFQFLSNLIPSKFNAGQRQKLFLVFLIIIHITFPLNTCVTVQLTCRNLAFNCQIKAEFSQKQNESFATDFHVSHLWYFNVLHVNELTN